MTARPRPTAPHTPFSTGCAVFDAVLGGDGGGWPRGRVVEIFGPAALAPSVDDLGLAAMVSAQAGGVVALVDLAHTFDPAVAEGAGVDCSALLVAQPPALAEALDIADTLVRSRAVDLVVVRLACVPAYDDAGGWDRHVTARVLSRSLRKLTAVASYTGALVAFIRDEDLDLGNALKFYSSIRVRLRLIDGDEGEAVEAFVVKNKLAAPFRSVVLGGARCAPSSGTPAIRFA